MLRSRKRTSTCMCRCTTFSAIKWKQNISDLILFLSFFLRAYRDTCKHFSGIFFWNKIKSPLLYSDVHCSCSPISLRSPQKTANWTYQRVVASCVREVQEWICTSTGDRNRCVRTTQHAYTVSELYCFQWWIIRCFFSSLRITSGWNIRTNCHP